MDVPVVNIGIVTDKELSFVFNEAYVHAEVGESLIGEMRAVCVGGKIVFNGKLFDELFFEPLTPAASFDLKAVTIGVDFHWERKEDQRFRGALNLIIQADQLIAINQVSIEEYLLSVISSEMSAVASLELLKAHAVISRSWLLAQTRKRRALAVAKEKYQTSYQDEHELIRWYDREDHDFFDVCADDHCQRYQGITRAYRGVVEAAIRETWGEVLLYDEEICDARFSKCCGGITERFETCWEPVAYPYLIPLRDYAADSFPNLTVETEAGQWIRHSPDAYCNTRDKRILSQVLNNYDQETTDFFRWKVTYTQAVLSELIRRKSGMDFGQIIDLIPLKRGSSGRIEKLKIVGSKRHLIVGKELEIRRTLSESHLYSSAFVVDKMDIDQGIPNQFVLTGAGWGHGVGLCQIGAAIMGDQGFGYKEILSHYYPGASVEKQYE